MMKWSLQSKKLAHVNATFNYSLELTNLSCGQNWVYKTYGAERSSVLKINCYTESIKYVSLFYTHACVLLSEN